MIREDRFCVYQHRLVSDNSVMYIGSGTRRRPLDKLNRNSVWNKITKENEWYCLILKTGMTKQDSENLEVSLINLYKPAANIRTTTLESKRLDTAEIDRRYYYDETSPSGVRWKIDNGGKGLSVRCAGAVAGSFVSKDNRYTVHTGKASRASYRVVWYLCTGEDPVGFVIDHIDGNTLNNKIGNLRKATVAENCRNTKQSVKCKTGYKGVSRTSCNRYVACWSENFVDKRKYFSCRKYGEDLAFALALEYRYLMLAKLNAAGSGFTERHTGVYVKHKTLEGVPDDEITAMFDCKASDKKWRDKYSLI